MTTVPNDTTVLSVGPWELLALCTLATLIWRIAGVAIASRVNPGSETFRWITCIAYAMLAALIARIMVLPAGLLEASHPLDRGLALGLGFLLFFVSGRKLAWGLLPAFLLFTVLSWARAEGYL